ncbi:hypothetical protein BH23BAC1_BH23BAC1_32760 [soil metagenome]
MAVENTTADRQQKPKIRSQYIGLIVGLLISLIIIKQEIFMINNWTGQKTEIVEVSNVQKEHSKTSSLSTENKYMYKFPEISGLAKMLIVTIHAPWIFNNQDPEKNYEEETGFSYSINSLNTFFSRFSFPVLKERSDLESCENNPLS